MEHEYCTTFLWGHAEPVSTYTNCLDTNPRRGGEGRVRGPAGMGIAPQVHSRTCRNQTNDLSNLIPPTPEYTQDGCQT